LAEDVAPTGLGVSFGFGFYKYAAPKGAKFSSPNGGTPITVAVMASIWATIEPSSGLLRSLITVFNPEGKRVSDGQFRGKPVKGAMANHSPTIG